MFVRQKKTLIELYKQCVDSTDWTTKGQSQYLLWLQVLTNNVESKRKITRALTLK